MENLLDRGNVSSRNISSDYWSIYWFFCLNGLMRRATNETLIKMEKKLMSWRRLKSKSISIKADLLQPWWIKLDSCSLITCSLTVVFWRTCYVEVRFSAKQKAVEDFLCFRGFQFIFKQPWNWFKWEDSSVFTGIIEKLYNLNCS